MSRQPLDPRDLANYVAALEARIAALEARSPFHDTGIAPSGGDTTVVIPGGDLDVDGNLNVDGTLNVGGTTTLGGDLTVVNPGRVLIDGGDLVSKSTTGADLLAIGPQPNGDRGLSIRREDGSLALETRKAFGPGDASQVLRLFDRVGRTIGGDSILSFTGFDAPHMDLRFIPVDYTAAALAVPVTSATFAATHECRTYHQNPAMKPQIMVRCSDGTTAGEVQFYDVTAAGYLGGYLGSPAVHTIMVPIGTTAWTLFELASSVALPGNMSDAIHLQIHARRTAGTGTVSVAPVRTVGSGL